MKKILGQVFVSILLMQFQTIVASLNQNNLTNPKIINIKRIKFIESLATEITYESGLIKISTDTYKSKDEDTNEDIKVTIYSERHINGPATYMAIETDTQNTLSIENQLHDGNETIDERTIDAKTGEIIN